MPRRRGARGVHGALTMLDPRTAVVAAVRASAFPPLDNELLASLPAGHALAAELEPMPLLPGTCLGEAGSPLSHAYFPACGLVSLGYTAVNGETAELALIGAEGMIGVGGLAGEPRGMHRALVRTFCLAYRVPVKTLRACFAKGGPFQDALLAYALRLMMHISRTSMCNLHHSTEQRLCRTLLQAVDRLRSSTLPMTHDVLAELVGARRQGISEAALRLRALGLIEYARGNICVLDRAALAARACECYLRADVGLAATRCARGGAALSL